MSDESDLAVSAGPEAVADEQGQVETQAAETAETPAVEDEAKRTETQKRRDRDRAHRERLRQEAEDAKAKAAEIAARHERLLAASKARAEPSEADFPDPLEHASARAVWKLQQQDRALEAKDFEPEVKAAQARAQEAERAEKTALAQQWGEQVNEAKSRYADFDKVALSNEVQISEPLALMLAQSEQGADLLYAIAQDREKAAHLSKLSLSNPMAAGMEIGRIAASLAIPKPRTATSAPSPINPLKGGGSGTKSPEDMDAAEFAAWRRAGGTFK